MIEFLRDYSTKSLPPEIFKDEQRVERSPESELYFVRLGLAAYVTEGGLVDADYRAIERKTLAVVEVVEPQGVLVGRAGEIPVTVDAPVRASSGPGNEAMFGTAEDILVVPVDPTLSPADAIAVATAEQTAAKPAGKPKTK